LALSALRMALVTAPYEPRLLWSRLRLAFIAWPHMPADDRDLVFQQIRFAWNRSRQDLMILAAELDQVELVRAALISRPTDAQIFEDMLRPQTP
jgi:membrane-anchored glycerophosphoryl diester phosphodiesterase (GDPDase)